MSPSNEQRVSAAISKRYQNVDKTKRDCMNLLNQYRGLTPKLERFVFNDGKENQMLNLGGTIPVSFKVFTSGNSRYLLNIEGTIPVTYKGSTYNIPICLWLLDNHPFSAPMAYVTPTSEMLIKSSKHVDQNGKIYLPYLHEWNPNNSDLVGLVQMMIMTFSEMPPVYAKPKFGGSQPSQTASTTPYPTTPYNQPGGYMPPYSPPSGGYPPYPMPGYPTSTPSAMPPAYPGGDQSTPYPTGPPGGLPYPVGGFGASPDPNALRNSVNQGPGNTGTISEEHIRASLISAVGDKLREKLREKYGDAQAEVAVLKQQKADLERGKEKLNTMISKLTAEQNEVGKSVRILRERESELRQIVEQTEATKESLDIDEAVTTTAPLYKQLVNAYAEEQATQDAVYYLGEALKRGTIDLDAYLRHVRALSRKQYELRATMSLCRQKANLPG